MYCPQKIDFGDHHLAPEYKLLFLRICFFVKRPQLRHVPRVEDDSSCQTTLVTVFSRVQSITEVEARRNVSTSESRSCSVLLSFSTYRVSSKKNLFSIFMTRTVNFPYLFFIAFLFQNMILRAFEILFKIFLFISPDWVLNIGT